MLVRSPNGTYEYIDYRETAPAAAYQDMFKGNSNGAQTAVWQGIQGSPG